jgi:hypothetical protein
LYVSALDARKINSKDGRLTADVRGEVKEDNKVLVIRRVHVSFHLRAPNPGEIRETVNRVHSVLSGRVSCSPITQACISDHLWGGGHT